MKKRKLFNQSGVGAVALLIILALIAGSVAMVKKNSPKRSRSPSTNPSEVAAGKEPILSFVTDPATVAPGEKFDLIIKVNPKDTNFHAFELYTKYDPSNLDFQIQDNLAKNISSAYPLIINTVDTNTQIISIIGTRTGSSFSGSEEQ